MLRRLAPHPALPAKYSPAAAPSLCLPAHSQPIPPPRRPVPAAPCDRLCRLASAGASPAVPHRSGAYSRAAAKQARPLAPGRLSAAPQQHRRIAASGQQHPRLQQQPHRRHQANCEASLQPHPARRGSRGPSPDRRCVRYKTRCRPRSIWRGRLSGTSAPPARGDSQQNAPPSARSGRDSRVQDRLQQCTAHRRHRSTAAGR
ncbi:hypothetical protein D3C78_999280 [compost metagenome]